MTRRRLGQRGFTLIEILVALAILAVIIVGALGVIGAVNLGGLVEGLPTGYATSRVAKDYTVATVFLQGLNEYVATLTGGALTCDGTSPPCTLTRVPGGAAPFGYSVWPPAAQDYQLNWTGLTVRLEIWCWDNSSKTYAYCDPPTTGDQLYMIRSTLNWSFKSASRNVVIERFIPFRPSIPIPNP